MGAARTAIVTGATEPNEPPTAVAAQLDTGLTTVDDATVTLAAVAIGSSAMWTMVVDSPASRALSGRVATISTLPS